MSYTKWVCLTAHQKTVLAAPPSNTRMLHENIVVLSCLLFNYGMPACCILLVIYSEKLILNVFMH